jgi:hypothetical protein
VIDEAVHDLTATPQAGAWPKGVFCHSGKIAHENPEDMELKLPSGTLGVRGTMVAGRVDETQKSSRLVLLGEGPENDTGAPVGAFEACNVGKCVRINRPGFGTTIDGPDSPPVRPFRFSPERSMRSPALRNWKGWVETATAERGARRTSQRVRRTRRRWRPALATEVSHHDGEGAEHRDARRLRTLDRLDQATTDVAQFSSQTVSVNGRIVEIPVDCSDAESCLLGITPFPGYDPFENFLPEEITTYDQLTTLAASGLQNAVTQAGLAVDLRAARPHDFRFDLNLGSRSAELAVSTSLNTSAERIAFSEVTDFSDSSGYAIGDLRGHRSGRRQPARAPAAATGVAIPNNGNGRPDSILQRAITTPDGRSGGLGELGR